MRRRSSSQINRPLSLRWSLTGILLLLAMFGHDAFMAAEPEAMAVSAWKRRLTYRTVGSSMRHSIGQLAPFPMRTSHMRTPNAA